MSRLLLRIALILTIVAGAGIIITGWGLRSSVKKGLEKNLEEQKSTNNQLTAEAAKQKKAAETAQASEKTMAGQLKETTTELENKKTALQNQENRTREVEGKLSDISKDLSNKQAEIDKYTKSLPPGMTIDQVNDKLKEYQEQFTTLEQEKKVLNEQLVKLDGEKKSLEEQARNRREGKLPPGLTGHILAVNDEWNFVVMDIGAKEGVIENVNMIVYRNGALIGKVKITSVEPSVSIADILPEWKQGEIQEGDTVIF